MQKKAFSILTVLTLVTVLTFAVVPNSYAADQEPTSFIDKLIAKFGLNKTEVEQTYTEYKQERQTYMNQRFNEKVDQLLSEGKITQTQKTQILNKHTELVQERNNNWEEFKNMDPEQKRAEMQKRHDEMEQWAEEIGIDFDEVFEMNGFGGSHKGMRGGGYGNHGGMGVN